MSRIFCSRKTTWLRAFLPVIGTFLAACATGKPQFRPEAFPPQGLFQPNANLFACPAIGANRPQMTQQGRIIAYNPIIDVQGIAMASVPLNDVCLSSGFGWRNGRRHDGIDLSSGRSVTVYAAAPGTIIEIRYRNGYGKQILLDHGRGIYSRYAHLSRFTSALRQGQRFGFGQALGTTGRTGNATGIHLHFEILTGLYNPSEKSWGLKAHDPFTFPAWNDLYGQVWPRLSPLGTKTYNRNDHQNLPARG